MGKKNIMVSVDEEFWRKAKQAGINMSGLLDSALEKKLFVKIEVPEKDMLPKEMTEKQKEVQQLAREFVAAFRVQILEGIKDNLAGREPQFHDGIKVVWEKDNHGQ